MHTAIHIITISRNTHDRYSAETKPRQPPQLHAIERLQFREYSVFTTVLKLSKNFAKQRIAAVSQGRPDK